MPPQANPNDEGAAAKASLATMPQEILRTIVKMVLLQDRAYLERTKDLKEEEKLERKEADGGWHGRGIYALSAVSSELNGLCGVHIFEVSCLLSQSEGGSGASWLEGHSSWRRVPLTLIRASRQTISTKKLSEDKLDIFLSVIPRHSGRIRGITFDDGPSFERKDYNYLLTLACRVGRFPKSPPAQHLPDSERRPREARVARNPFPASANRASNHRNQIPRGVHPSRNFGATL